jgi:hypothetical protein
MTMPLTANVHRRTRGGTASSVYGVTLAVAESIRRIVVWQRDATEAVDGVAARRLHHSTRRRPTPPHAVNDLRDRS